MSFSKNYLDNITKMAQSKTIQDIISKYPGKPEEIKKIFSGEALNKLFKDPGFNNIFDIFEEIMDSSAVDSSEKVTVTSPWVNNKPNFDEVTNKDNTIITIATPGYASRDVELVFEDGILTISFDTKKVVSPRFKLDGLKFKLKRSVSNIAYVVENGLTTIKVSYNDFNVKVNYGIN